MFVVAQQQRYSPGTSLCTYWNGLVDLMDGVDCMSATVCDIAVLGLVAWQMTQLEV